LYFGPYRYSLKYRLYRYIQYHFLIEPFEVPIRVPDTTTVLYLIRYPPKTLMIAYPPQNYFSHREKLTREKTRSFVILQFFVGAIFLYTISYPLSGTPRFPKKKVVPNGNLHLVTLQVPRGLIYLQNKRCRYCRDLQLCTRTFIPTVTREKVIFFCTRLVHSLMYQA
jgi:hypothetical protein